MLRLVRMRGSVPAELWVLIASAFVIAIGYGLISPVLPTFAQSFDVGVAAASAAISAFALSRLLFAPVSGALVTRIGERWVYLAGLLIVAIAQIITAYSPTYAVLILSRIIGGIGSTMFTVSAMGLVIRLSPADIRGRVAGLYASSFLLGGVLGPVIGGALVGFGMRLPFIVYAISLVVAVCVVGIFLPATSLERGADADIVAPFTFWDGLKHPAFQAALTSNFANGWVNFGVRMAQVPLLVTVLGSPPWVAGAAMAAFAGGNGLAVTRSGRFSDSKGRRPLVILGLLICGLATVFIGAMMSGWMVCVLSFVAGFGVGVMGPCQQAAIADIIGSSRSGSGALASFQMAADLGAIIGPLVAGLIADHYGFGWGFAVSGILLTLTTFGWWKAPETHPRPGA